jgi:hypothetical protein
MLHGLRLVLVAVGMTIGWLGRGAEAGATEKFELRSLAAGANANFLYPETVALRGCSTPLQPQQRSRIITGESSRHYCVANFVRSEKWEISTRGIDSRVSYPFDTQRDSEVLAVGFGKADPGVAKAEFKLTTASMRQPRFERVDSVRVWVKGNGSSAGLRVWLVDRDGRIFTPQRPLGMNFDVWSLEDLPFASGFVLGRGIRTDGNPNPPLALEGISIAGLPEALRGEIKISRVSVVGVLWHDDRTLSDSQASGALIGTQEPPAALELHLIKFFGRHVPMNAGSTVQVNVAVKNHLETAASVNIDTTVHSILGGTETYETLEQLGPGVRREVSIPINLAFPGWYRAVICARLGAAPLSCVHDEYFVWDAAGNDVEDSPRTFPGAMMSADLFLGELGDDLQTMKQAGIKVLRFPFRWEKIEPMRGKYDWGPYDNIFELCRRANIIPQPLAMQTPDWARRAPYRASRGTGSATASAPPEDMATFERFMEKAAGRYAMYSPYWEIWNEPTSPVFWAGGTNADYIALLRAGYNGVKAADRAARVLSAGAWAVDGVPERFSRHLMENGRSYFDILAVHSHGGVHQLSLDLDDFDRLWAGVKNRPPIWLNETGVSIDPSRSDGELVKAAETVKKMIVARARGVDNFGWFIFKGLPNSYQNPYNNFSAMDESGGPRPVLLAYNNVIRWLRKTRLERVGNDARSYTTYEFRGGERRVLVAWARDPEAVTPLTRLPTWVAGGVDVYNMFGGPAAAMVGRNPLTIELTGNPVFLIARDAAQ